MIDFEIGDHVCFISRKNCIDYNIIITTILDKVNDKVFISTSHLKDDVYFNGYQLNLHHKFKINEKFLALKSECNFAYSNDSEYSIVKSAVKKRNEWQLYKKLYKKFGPL